MDTKLLARTGAAVFVGLAIATTIVQLREEPAPVRQADRRIWVPDGDPLPAQLRVCAQIGELALSSPDCRAAWAEKRRRFFGVDHPEAYSGIGDKALPESLPSEARSRAAQEDAVHVREARHVLEVALAELPQKTARIFAMNRIEKKSYRQIHLELGIALPTVDYHMMKALAHLRQALGHSR